MPTRLQSYFHPKDPRAFDYDKFYFSLKSFLDPMVKKGQLYFTTIFIHQDPESKKVYGQYKIREAFKTEENFLSEAKWLESYEINFNDPANEAFSIYQIYENFEHLNVDDTVGPLIKQNIGKYFTKLNKPKSKAEKEKIRDLPPSTENFLYLESLYVSRFLDKIKGKNEFYLPVPIIAFGNLVGIVYLIYDEKAIRGKIDEKEGEIDLKPFYRSIILQTTREYERNVVEGKFITFDFKPEDPLADYYDVIYELRAKYKQKDDQAKLKRISYPFLYEFREREPMTLLEENEFLKNLGYVDYYENLFEVIVTESYQLRAGRMEKIRTAISSIIIDSFAHNIGAHSLAALKWWFEIRYRAISKKMPLEGKVPSSISPETVHKRIFGNITRTKVFHKVMDDFEHRPDAQQSSLLNIIRFMNDEEYNSLLRFHVDEALIFELPVPVTQYIYYFFQYLRDKSAYWSGATRDITFTGRMKSWPQIFKSFLNNALFLGTIAHSEGINKIYFHLEILDKNNKVKVAGEYAQINLEVLKEEKEKVLNQNTTYTITNDPNYGYSDYAFLRMGKDFEEIYPCLNKLDNVFLPNGIIGQHALYTLLENTLRNIKHYKKSLKQISNEGLIFYVSIQEQRFLKRMDDDIEQFRKDYNNSEEYEKKEKYNWTKDSPLYKIGAWLHHPQKLYTQKGAKVNEEEDDFYPEKGSIIDAHMQQLKRRVVDEGGQPILGGSSQDKVCAGMLMNNYFLGIDSVNLNKVKRQYYPYVYAASEEYQAPAERILNKKFKVEDKILHKVYNDALVGKTSDIRREKYKKHVIEYIDDISYKSDGKPTKRGTIKKYFHVWKGEKCKLVSKEFNPRHENLARFRILAVKNYKMDENQAALPFRCRGDMESRKNTAEYDFRNIGVIRLVEADEDWAKLEKQELYENAMQKWLGDWLIGDQDKSTRKRLYIFKEGGGQDENKEEDQPDRTMDESNPLWRAEPVWKAKLYFEEGNWQIEIIPVMEINFDKELIFQELGINDYDPYNLDIAVEALAKYRTQNDQILLVQHGGGDKAFSQHICKLRSHTSFLNDIFENCNFKDFMYEDFDKNENGSPREKDSPLKLLETVFTNISIFDARVHERLPGKKEEHSSPNSFQDQLNLYTYPEDPEIFRKVIADTEVQDGIFSKRGHFIIMHLSFLESIYQTDILWDEDGNKREDGKKIPYKETEVKEFYINEIESILKKKYGPKNAPFNTILVITSGRGRGDWFNATQHPQITFRPIEAILGAIEDGLSLKDDFEVKYNLCNVLFGS